MPLNPTTTMISIRLGFHARMAKRILPATVGNPPQSGIEEFSIERQRPVP